MRTPRSGPSSWWRAGLASWARAPGGVAPPQHHALPAVTVSSIHTTDDQVSFHVSRVGVPVVVRVSYFPSWHAIGALGPVALGAQPHGGRADVARRHAHLRSQRPRQARDAARAWSGSSPWACSSGAASPTPERVLKLAGPRAGLTSGQPSAARDHDSLTSGTRLPHARGRSFVRPGQGSRFRGLSSGPMQSGTTL